MSFEGSLSGIFAEALRMRMGWDLVRDAKYEFDFPHLVKDFDERVHVDLEDAKGDQNIKRKVLQCLMPGIRARVRARDSEEYGEEIIICRAAVLTMKEGGS